MSEAVSSVARARADEAVEHLDVLVVGAGFFGLYQLDRLRAGFSVKKRSTATT